jgi:hypothetical protein
MGAKPRPIEVTAIAPIRSSAIEVDGIDFEMFGITAIRVMRGNEVVSTWRR